MSFNSFLLTTVPLTAGLYFVLTAFLKTLSPGSFTEHLSRLQFIPGRLIPVIRLGIPVFSLLLGFSLILGNYLNFTVPAAILFILAGLLITLWGLSKNYVNDCGCYGPIQFIPVWATLALHAVLLAGLIRVRFHPLSETGGWGWAAACTLMVLVPAMIISRTFFLNKDLLQPGDDWDPEWLLESRENKEASSGDYLIFLNPECTTCARWIPFLNVLDSLKPESGPVGILPASTGGGDSFKEKFGIKFKVRLMEDKQFYEKISQTPTAFKLAKNKIIARWTGDLPGELEHEFKNYYANIA